MLNNWKYRLTTGWNFMRAARLAIALFLIVGSWKQADYLVMAVGGFFLVQSLLNYGCCGMGGCEIDTPVKKTGNYEEIKNNK